MRDELMPKHQFMS